MKATKSAKCYFEIKKLEQSESYKILIEPFIDTLVLSLLEMSYHKQYRESINIQNTLAFLLDKLGSMLSCPKTLAYARALNCLTYCTSVNGAK